MALVQSGDLAWNDASFNFHLAQGQGATFHLDPHTQTALGPFSYQLYGHSRTLPTHTPFSDTSLTQVTGDRANVLVGYGLTVDAKGHLTGGTINQITVADIVKGVTSHVYGTVVGANIDAVAFQRAANTVSTKDDFALMRTALQGKDLVGLSQNGDRFHSYSGGDLVFGNGGDDWLYLGDGNDGALGGTGRDKLFGEVGDDVLIGNQGNDRVFGGAGRDTIDGGKNNDFLHGGDDADTFFFVRGDGTDTIDDFHPHQDVIDIGSGATSFAQLHLEAHDQYTVVTFANVSITLTNVKRADLSASDFHFNPDLSYLQFDNLADLFNFKA